jgi:hypothetical protein
LGTRSTAKAHYSHDDDDELMHGASWKVSKWRQAGTAAGRKTLRMSRPFDAKVDE